MALNQKLPRLAAAGARDAALVDHQIAGDESFRRVADSGSHEAPRIAANIAKLLELLREEAARFHHSRFFS